MKKFFFVVTFFVTIVFFLISSFLIFECVHYSNLSVFSQEEERIKTEMDSIHSKSKDLEEKMKKIRMESEDKVGLLELWKKEYQKVKNN